MNGEAAFAKDGIAVLPRILSGEDVRALRAVPEMAAAGRPGARAVRVSDVVRRTIGSDGPLGLLAQRLMGRSARPVRILCFDKTAETNWSVPWHQDRTLAVSGPAEVPGYGPWTLKQGTHHVEPPPDLLAGMVALRLHLDDCGYENGPLLALPGSWSLGKVTAPAVLSMAAAAENIRVLTASAGDVVAMRGLTVHASAKSVKPGHRRVIHVDYATHALPPGLDWAM